MSHRLRPLDDSRDAAFTEGWFASCVAYDLAALPEPVRAMLLAQQARAWTAGLGRHGALEDLILEDAHGTPLGRMILARAEDATLRIVELGVLPASRGGGLGAWMITQAIDHAEREGRTLVLTTRRDGAARRLYERMGLVLVGEDELHARYERRP